MVETFIPFPRDCPERPVVTKAPRSRKANPETLIQNAIRVALSRRGIVLRLNNGVFYTESGQRIASGLPPGTSDLLFIGEGRAAFIEVKTPAGRVSDAQQHFIDVVRSHGVRAGVARSVDDAIKIIEGDI